MFSKIFKRTMVGVLTLGLALVINGCGQVDQAPVASDVAQAEGISYIAFSPQAPFRAAKYSDGGILVDSDLIGAAGDTLYVEDLGDEGPADDLALNFEVFAGGLDSEHQITMTVTKGSLSQVVAAFQPVGLNFLIDSELQFIVGSDLVDVDLSSLIAWHIHGDGSAEHAQMWAEVVGDKTIVHVKVPGFSRYSIDD
jgi:hypothetical protein